MKTVAQAFHHATQALELTEAEVANISRQQNVVRDELRKHLGGIDRDFLSGSYGRRTAIRPLHDIDLFLVLNPQFHAGLRGVDPGPCLVAVRDALARAYPNKQAARLQGRSVNIEFSGSGIGYDIVPAFSNGTDAYLIPDRTRQSWIRTNPEIHRQKLVAANQRAGGKLVPLVKLAKHVNAGLGRPLASFHLEVMSYEAFSGSPPSYPDGLAFVLAHLSERVLQTCRDPAGLGPNIDNGMTQAQRTSARETLRGAAVRARDAIAHATAGRHSEAHACWRSLLGGIYPERG